MNRYLVRTGSEIVVRVWKAARIFTPALVLVSSFAMAQPIGYVLEVEGAWTVHGHPKVLVPGEILSAGAMLENLRPSEIDRLVVADNRGVIIKRLRCEKRACNECGSSGECQDPIRPLPAAAARPGKFDEVLKAAISLLFGDQDRYSTIRVRSGELQDGVVLLKAGELYLGPVFVRQDAGRYYVALSRLEHSSATPTAMRSGPIYLEWTPGALAEVRVPSASPGLYELTLLERAPNGYRTTTSTAWILARSTDEFTEATAAFRQAMVAASTWGTDVLPETARAFGRAYLEQLSRTPMSSPR